METITLQDGLEAITIHNICRDGYITPRTERRICDSILGVKQGEIHYIETVKDYIEYTNSRGSTDIYGLGTAGLASMTRFMRRIGYMFDLKTQEWVHCELTDEFIIEEVGVKIRELYPEIKLLDGQKFNDIIADILRIYSELQHDYESCNAEALDTDQPYENSEANKYTSEVEKMINDHGTTSVK